jgi:hypothetical protein
VKVIPKTSEAVPPAWVKEHQVSFELAPFREHVKGERLQQTGQLLSLFGRFDPRAVDDPVKAARSIHERLHALALEALRDLPVPSLMQVEPFGRAVVPRDAPLLMDVPLTVVASPPGKEQQLPPSELRRVIELVDSRLRALGLKKR